MKYYVKIVIKSTYIGQIKNQTKLVGRSFWSILNLKDLTNLL